MELRLLALYPEQMNIYADRGNIVFLRHRCEWRGIGFSYAVAGPGDPVDPDAQDLIYIGGGQMIHAPATGDVVKVSPVNWSRVVGVSRPG